MNTIGEPKIDTRPAQFYVGIRTVTPFSGMFKIVTKMSKDLHKWARSQNIEAAGPPFLRYHVIDMQGSMEITYGLPTRQALPADGSISSDTLVPGRYVSLIYTGSGLAGNKALIEWARAQGLEFDRWDTEQGDNFRCRYESHLTDPRLEPRKTRWQIEVAIKLRD